MITAITITFNRLDLTRKMIESFYAKTSVDRHIFIDNGSTDGTAEFLQDKDAVLLNENTGISRAFIHGIKMCEGDFILKLDNDIEIITEGLVDKILAFYSIYGLYYVVSPRDINIPDNYEPNMIRTERRDDLDLRFTSHTGGAFQVIPIDLARRYAGLTDPPAGDLNRGLYFQSEGYEPVYVNNWEIAHPGLNNSVDDYIL